ncbi:MAG: hypothetical protein GY938_14945 [Ketobacter sp.]|nr:hypothetical protein [Ketobacter sp.]
MLRNGYLSVWREFREMLPALAFFMMTFHMIAITKSIVLSAASVSAVDASTASVAALLVAKAILIVDKLAIADLFNSVAWRNVIWRTLLFYLVTLLFHLLERASSYYLRPGPQVFDIGEILEWISWPYFLVMQMWLLVLVLMFTLLREIIQLVGHDQLVRLLTQKRQG